MQIVGAIWSVWEPENAWHLKENTDNNKYIRNPLRQLKSMGHWYIPQGTNVKGKRRVGCSGGSFILCVKEGT